MGQSEAAFTAIEEQLASNPDCEQPALTMDEFFRGNDWDGIAIGCNLEPVVPIERFRAVLESIAAKAEVFALWIIVSEWHRNLGWPFADRVLLSTEAPIAEIESWFFELRPSEFAKAMVLPHRVKENSPRSVVDNSVMGLTSLLSCSGGSPPEYNHRVRQESAVVRLRRAGESYVA